MCATVLAVDFGTSNSAAAMLEAGAVRRIPIETGAETLPTAVFFPAENGAMRIGSEAGKALIDGEEGRYMRALKSILGTTLFHETRWVGGKRRSLAEIVTAFLAVVKQRAEAQTGQDFSHVLSGRPVHFHSADPERDARAEADLRGCYEAAGFTEIRFLFEPEAAAHAANPDEREDALGLILDIGGGTSDFSLFRRNGSKTEILASHGIRLGGTDFDQEISMNHVMPLLGHGGLLRRSFGEGLLPVPNAIYRDLSNWASIPFLYVRETERAVEDLLRHAVESEKIGRLQDVITEQLGHELAFAVERGKIAANRESAAARIDLGFIDPALSARITPGSLNAALSGFREKLRTAIMETFLLAQIPPNRVDSLVLVGGSSLMRLVSDEAREICPGATLRRSDAFTAVVDGLALASAEAFSA
ncbi:Hsp70 family protein [Tropicimonas sp. TH_r6]|uniref:Hsp70 family protein n=1 Tax=Tropicimonas sp. TH_r6 TaxID=3082085 RepID=UPI002954C3FB|nr:Hsp70 family protein [Tropicimonas sp. TH_r6]MDV7141421.1 Hsp70 family protein [Tropicimonas sp. TH_r6]